MKKLILILIVFTLVGCNAQNKQVKIQTNVSSRKVIVGSWSDTGKKIVKVEGQKEKTKNIIWKSSDKLSEISKELSEEFNYIYSSTDSNHYENKCYLLLDIDYKNKQFVLYRNKWVGIWTWWCKLDWVEKIWVLWYHNWKPDPDWEYILKSYNPKTWLFKYVINEKYGNLGSWENEYEFRFYLSGGKVVKEYLGKRWYWLKTEDLSEVELNNKFFDRYWVYQVLKEKCGIKSYSDWGDFDLSKIPTESWEELGFVCNENDWSLIYKWNDEYILKLCIPLEWPYSVFIKNRKIIKEWYEICWKLFKTMDDFYNLTGELAVWDLLNNKCKFIDITTWFKYSGYYYAWGFMIISWTDSEYEPGCWAYNYNDNDLHNFVINWKLWNTVELYDTNNQNKSINAKIKYFNNKYWRSFLLFENERILKLKHHDWCDWEWWMIYKTFLNWKEVK